MKPLKATLIFISLASVVLWVGLFWRHGRPAAPSLSTAKHPVKQASAKASSGLPFSERIAKIFKGDPPKLTPEQIRKFVEQKHHSAGSLLAAWHLGGDESWLEEAARRYPDNPQVALAMVNKLPTESGDAKAWIERLQQSAPDNAIGWCFSALASARSGQGEEAQKALSEAASRGSINSYSQEEAATMTEAYRSAGIDGVEAELLGMAGVVLPQATLMMSLQREMIAGSMADENAKADMLKLAASLNSQEGNKSLILDLVNITVEKNLLGQSDAFDFVPNSDTLVADRLLQIDAQRAAIKELVRNVEPLLLSLTDTEFKQYLRRNAVQGEFSALQWVANLKNK